MVDLPAPECPTRATSWPGSTVRSMSVRTRRSESWTSAPGNVERGDRDLVGRRVAERDVVELDAARRIHEVHRADVVGDGDRSVEHLEHPVEADQRAHQIDAGVGEPGDRLVDAPGVRRHRDEGSDLDRSAHNHLPTDAVDQRCPDRGDHAEGDEEHPSVHRRLDPLVADLRRPVREGVELVLAPTEQLHEGRAGDVEALRHLRVEAGVEVHLRPGDDGQLAPHPAGGSDEQRQQDEGEDGEPPLEPQHHGQGRGEHDDVGHDRARASRSPRSGRRPRRCSAG